MQAHPNVQETKLPRILHLESLGKVPDKVLDSGCRDDAPTPQILKNILCCERKFKRCHTNELISLQKMVDLKTNKDSEVLQKVLMHPKGVIIWFSTKDAKWSSIIHLDANRSIVCTILCVWIGCQKSIKGCIPSTCANIWNLWPHSLSPVFLTGI